MLKLTRKTGEALIIGDDTEVTVLSVDGNQVKIGIDAPDDVAIHREEVYHRIREKVVQDRNTIWQEVLNQAPEMDL